MGYSISAFTADIDQNLICGICGGVLEDAVLIPCGHSFCHTCLHTWLDRPCTNTCPECRTLVMITEAMPILSVRNLILSMEATCDYTDRGCVQADTMENIQKHINTCSFSPIECNACGDVLNRVDLPAHQIECPALAAVLNDSIFEASTNDGTSVESRDSSVVADLSAKVESMNGQLRKMKDELMAAENRNAKLERELRNVKNELEDKSHLLRQQRQADELFEAGYDYGYTPQSVIRLARFVSFHYDGRPPYVDRNRLFVSVKRCYEHYGRFNRDRYLRDVHMLITTCRASDWFSDSHMVTFEAWLEVLQRNKNACN